MREWFRVEAAAEKGKGGGDILIYGSIGKSWWDEDAVSAKAFVKELDGLIKAGPGDVHIRINSPGGNVGDGMAIYNAIRNVKDRCYATIEGTAYSMASVIALAGRETRMHDTGQFMVHNPSVSAYGGEKEMESAIKALKTAKTVLVKAYTAKTGKAKAEVEEIMGDTTFMTADEAKEFGFVDAVIEGDELQKVAACFDAWAWREYYEGRGGVPVDGTQRREGAKDEDALRAGGQAGSLTHGSAANEDGKPGEEHESENNRSDAPKEEAVMKMTELKAACPGASAEFLNTQMEACEKDEKRTITDVVTAFAVEQTRALTEARAALVEAQNKAPETPAPVTVPGVAPLAASGGSDGPEGDALEQFEDAVSAFEAKKMTRAQAIRAVVNGKPELHKAYLAAYNAQHGRTIN